METPTNVIELTPELIADYKNRQIIQDWEEELELDSVAGLQVLGELTDEEKAIFIEVSNLDHELNDWGRELSGRSLETMANTVRDTQDPKDFVTKLADKNIFTDDVEAESYFFDLQRYYFLSNLFWFSLRNRLHTFATVLSIRAGYKVCRVGYKYKSQLEQITDERRGD